MVGILWADSFHFLNIDPLPSMPQSLKSFNLAFWFLLAHSPGMKKIFPGLSFILCESAARGTVYPTVCINVKLLENIMHINLCTKHGEGAVRKEGPWGIKNGWA